MSKTKKHYPLLNSIIAYESGELPQKELFPFFAELIRSGKAWILQGFYGRQADDYRKIFLKGIK